MTGEPTDRRIFTIDGERWNALNQALDRPAHHQTRLAKLLAGPSKLVPRTERPSGRARTVRIQVDVNPLDDALLDVVGRRFAGYTWLDFDGIQVVVVTTAADLVEEAKTVVDALEAAGIRVIRVYEDLVTMDVAIDRVTRWFGGEPDGWGEWPLEPSWPVPAGVIGGEKIWRWNEIVAWLYTSEPEQPGVTAREVAAINIHIETTP